jgi:hypothetical protein
VSTTDRLDDVYTPCLPVDPRYARYFEPTAITNAAGDLSEDVMDDLLDTRYQPVRVAIGR